MKPTTPPSIKVTGCSIVTAADGSTFGRVTAYVSDPSGLSYTATLRIDGRSRTFAPATKSGPYTFDSTIATTATCSASLS